MSGSGTILQYKVDFTRNSSLNPLIKKPLDCGANTLYLLGILNLDGALKLADLQNKCVPGKEKYLQYKYVFSKFLFTDKKKVYSVFQCNKEELIDEAEKQLKEGYGTIIYMFPFLRVRRVIMFVFIKVKLEFKLWIYKICMLL
jgi:hypothetical protein